METGRTGLEVIYTERYKACFELCLSHGGRNLRAVEREMRGLGFADFHRRILYSRTERGVYKPGWIERFGWKDHLPAASPSDVRKNCAPSGSRSSALPSDVWKGSAFPKGIIRCSEGCASAAVGLTTPPTQSGGHPSLDKEGSCAPFSPPCLRRGGSPRFLRTDGVVTPASQQSPQEDFAKWLKQVSPELNWDWKYQKYIYKYLQRVTDGTCKRLMIFMPPRHGKSELVTIRYASWRLWNDPKTRVIIASYNQKLADRFSRSIRRLLSEEEDKRKAALICPDVLTTPSARKRREHPPLLRHGGENDTRQERENDTPLPSLNKEGWQPDVFDPADGVVNHPTDAQAQETQRSDHSYIRQPVDYPQCTADASQPGQSKIPNPKSKTERMFPPSRTINTVSNWETAAGGGVKAVGVGAGVTGFGGQLVIIDDPVKSRAEAESETYRTRLWDWYRNDLYTRLEPNAAVILIQTRWHQDDLAGRLLQEMQNGGDQWEVINLPALAEELRDEGGTAASPQCTAERLCPSGDRPYSARGSASTGGIAANQYSGTTGEAKPLRDASGRSPVLTDMLGRLPGRALCPERFDETKLEEINRQLGSYNFSALYQQHPVPAEGGIFKRSWFKRFVSAPPAGLKWKRGYDLAVSTKTTACYTASFRVAIDESTGDMYIDGGYRERIEYPDQRRYIIDRVTAERDTEHGIEKALHGQALMQDLRRDPRLFGKNIRAVEVTADKVTRALKWAPLAEEGKLVLVRAAWNREFLEEIANFPAGQNDDQIDAVSLAVSMLQRKGRKAYGF